MSVGCYGQLNNNLHKQTRRIPPSGDMSSPVENHDLVPSLLDTSKSQAHSRVHECDGYLLSRSNQVQSTEWSLRQTDLSKVVHSSC